MKASTPSKEKKQFYEEQARELLKDLPWPDKKNELWRRTPLSLIAPEHFTGPAGQGSPGPAAPLPPEDGEALSITFGSRPADWSLPDETEPGFPQIYRREEEFPLAPEEEEAFRASPPQDRFAAWSRSETTGFVGLDFPAGEKLNRPLRLVFNALSRDRYSLPRIFLRFREGWEGELVLIYNGEARGGERELVNGMLRVAVGAASRVRLREIQNLGPQSRLVQNALVAQQADSSLRYTLLQLGAAVVKSDHRFLLRGSGADLRIGGFSTAGRGQHKDVRILQEHQAPRSSSRADYRTFVDNRGRSVFQGLIRVAENAAGTNAYLDNKNLILSPGSRADAVPSLKILTDDVQCSHGSTTGRLEPSRLFYLCGRGLSEEQAKELLLEGRMAEILRDLPDDLRSWVEEQGLNHLKGDE